MFTPFVIGLALAIGVSSDDPTLVVTPAANTAEVLESSVPSLLAKARQLRSDGDPAYGDMFRRAAWEAHQRSGSLGAAIDILDELLGGTASVFDAFDAHRMMGQFYAKAASDQADPTLWSASLDRYSIAISLARQEPSLVDAHPLVFVSVMQGAALSASAASDPALAAALSVELRDHPSERIPTRSRRAAALMAARQYLRADAAAACEAAWVKVAEIAPDLFEGRSSVNGTRLERARALDALNGGAEAQESLWWDGNVKQYDTGLTVARLLVLHYLADQESPDLESALAVSLDAWEAVKTHEQTWRAALEGPDEATLTTAIHGLLFEGTELALHLEAWEDAHELAQAYLSRYGSPTDQRGAAWLEMARTGLAGE